ncbi:HET-domain-containing protein [Jackrogersella minutella]|nr:HET-domain-containing protein [Jackrogersella minutella]
MGQCDTCASLTVEDLRGKMTFYHTSLRSLRDSAAAGCDMCRLCFASIQQSYVKEPVDAVLAGKCPGADGGQPIHDERVWLTGSFQDIFRRGGGAPGPAKAKMSDSASEVWVSCGSKDDPEKTVFSPVLTGTLNVFADRGTPAASRFVERYIVSDRNPDGHIEFARALLAGCKKNHPECGSADADSAPEMPTRVLDLGISPGSTKLVSTHALGLREPYLALSYCWGQGVRHATELNDGNHGALLESVDETALTTTHLECMGIARQLGIRYVWIDSLCIIQGNLADWNYESKRMAQVYGNATLTVIAARSADSRLSFLDNRVVPAAPPCALRLGRRDDDGKDMGDVFLSLPRSDVRGPLNSRGWCFQEAVLSRRKLVFETQMIYFSCQRSERYETGRMKEADQLRPRLFQSLRDNTLNDVDAANNLRAEMLDLWYKKVLWNYTQRQLTNPHDIFAAVSGIAQLAQQSIKSRYLAGLWEADMARGLLWHTWFSFGARSDRDYGSGVSPLAAIEPRRPTDWHGKPAVRAPSWSWASIQGQVHERSTPRDIGILKDPSNYLIRPKASPQQHVVSNKKNDDAEPTWSAPGNPECDADVIHMPVCELSFLGRPKPVRCSAWTEVAGFAGKWQLPRGRKRRLARQGYVVLLEPAKSEYARLDALGLLPVGHNSSGVPPAIGGSSNTFVSPALVFAEACFDVAEESVGVTDCWFLPLIKQLWKGLLLRRDPSDGKFRRLGLAVVSRTELLPWIISGPEEEVYLV